MQKQGPNGGTTLRPQDSVSVADSAIAREPTDGRPTMSMPRAETRSRIAFVGNYLPRECGIATFTTDLCAALAGTAAPVDHTPQGGKQRWRALHLVDHDQAVGMGLEVHVRVGELGCIGRRLEVQVQRRRPIANQFQRQRRLADLARAEDRHGRELTQELLQEGQAVASVHPCNSSTM